MRNYSSTITKNPVQTEPIPGKEMVKNNAGGYTFSVSALSRLDRFLILGADSPTFYATQRDVLKDNVAALQKLATELGPKMVDRIVEISDAGRAPSNDPAIFALVVAAKYGNDETRKAAYAALPKVCRIGTHLYHFIKWATDSKGWSRGMRTAVSKWFTEMPVEKLVYQLIKYQARDGVSSGYAINGAHMLTERSRKFQSETQKVALDWAVKGWDSVGSEPHPDKALAQIWAFERAKTANKAELLKLISQYRLPLECIPTEFKNDPDVWAALLPGLGLEAVVRNLANMTRSGYVAPLSSGTKAILEKLGNPEIVKNSRFHPVSAIKALLTYASGRGIRGTNTWTPVTAVSTALETLFYASFTAVEPTGKAFYKAVDVSGSMTGGQVANTPGFTPNMAAGVMSMVSARTEKVWHVAGFTDRLVTLNITPKMDLATICRELQRNNFGRTDCSQPMLDALEKKMEVDVFEVFTDNETYAGSMHPSKALEKYRQKMGRDAKLIVYGMTSTGFTIADPSDKNSLDVVGFDSAVPQVVNQFILGS